MKPLLLLLCLGGALSAAAQFDNQKRARLDSLQRVFRERLQKRGHNIPNAFSSPGIHFKKDGTDTLVFVAPLGPRDTVIYYGGRKRTLLPPSTPGVHRLPVDNMPCIVPDTNGVAVIPNAFAEPKVPFAPARNIPNPMDRTLPQLRK